MIDLKIEISTKGILNKYLLGTTTQNLKKETLTKEKVDVKISANELKTIAERVADSITYNIGAGLKYTGGKVAKNKPSTIRKKRQNYPLYETGDLFKSIKVKNTGGKYVVYVDSSRNEVATYLQQGGKHMVARPFFGITKKKFNEIFNDVIKKKKGYVPDLIKKLRS